MFNVGFVPLIQWQNTQWCEKAFWHQGQTRVRDIILGHHCDIENTCPRLILIGLAIMHVFNRCHSAAEMDTP